MMKFIYLFRICILFVFTFHHVQAQTFTPNVIGSAGTFASYASGSTSWTIGEIMGETYLSAGNSFTQGFHQPETTLPISVSESSIQNFYVFPNPVLDNLTADLSLLSGKCILQIVDMKGQLLKTISIPAGQKQATISFREFTNGMYLLNVLDEESNKRISYKINKSE